MERFQPYFLGGHDLEMIEIARVLRSSGCRVFDRHLSWAQATFIAYEAEISEAIQHGHRPILVELFDIPGEVRGHVDVVDHHGPSSGSIPSSLEQVLQRLGRTPTREQLLIAANDRGHIDAMLQMGATAEEIARIRCADRSAQGITQDEERQAEAAIAKRDTSFPALTVVTLAHSKTATVTDRLHRATGGPGYENLLIESPDEVTFFGDGAAIEQLTRALGGFSGGRLPVSGFWGIEGVDPEQKVRIAALIRHALKDTVHTSA